MDYASAFKRVNLFRIRGIPAVVVHLVFFSGVIFSPHAILQTILQGVTPLFTKGKLLLLQQGMGTGGRPCSVGAARFPLRHPPRGTGLLIVRKLNGFDAAEAASQPAIGR